LLNDFKAEGMQTMPGPRRLCEEPQLGEAEFTQDLTARTGISRVDRNGSRAGAAISGEVRAVRVVFAWSADSVEDLREVAIAHVLGSQIDHHPLSSLSNGSHRSAESTARRRLAHIEDVTKHITAVNTR
jgi:hypothetical protein